MANRVGGMYLKTASAGPSKSLQDYLGEYLTIFNPTPCDTKDDDASCKITLQAYLDDEHLYFKNKPSSVIGYPVVVKGDTAYIIPSTAAFEELLGCGSLK
jgi:hypothetical protein